METLFTKPRAIRKRKNDFDVDSKDDGVVSTPDNDPDARARQKKTRNDVDHGIDATEGEKKTEGIESNTTTQHVRYLLKPGGRHVERVILTKEYHGVLFCLKTRPVRRLAENEVVSKILSKKVETFPVDSKPYSSINEDNPVEWGAMPISGDQKLRFYVRVFCEDGDTSFRDYLKLNADTILENIKDSAFYHIFHRDQTNLEYIKPEPVENLPSTRFVEFTVPQDKLEEVAKSQDSNVSRTIYTFHKRCVVVQWDPIDRNRLRYTDRTPIYSYFWHRMIDYYEVVDKLPRIWTAPSKYCRKSLLTNLAEKLQPRLNQLNIKVSQIREAPHNCNFEGRIHDGGSLLEIKLDNRTEKQITDAFANTLALCYSGNPSQDCYKRILAVIGEDLGEKIEHMGSGSVIMCDPFLVFCHNQADVRCRNMEPEDSSPKFRFLNEHLVRSCAFMSIFYHHSPIERLAELARGVSRNAYVAESEVTESPENQATDLNMLRAHFEDLAKDLYLCVRSMKILGNCRDYVEAMSYRLSDQSELVDQDGKPVQNDYLNTSFMLYNRGRDESCLSDCLNTVRGFNTHAKTCCCLPLRVRKFVDEEISTLTRLKEPTLTERAKANVVLKHTLSYASRCFIELNRAVVCVLEEIPKEILETTSYVDGLEGLINSAKTHHGHSPEERKEKPCFRCFQEKPVVPEDLLIKEDHSIAKLGSLYEWASSNSNQKPYPLSIPFHRKKKPPSSISTSLSFATSSSGASNNPIPKKTLTTKFNQNSNTASHGAFKIRFLGSPPSTVDEELEEPCDPPSSPTHNKNNRRRNPSRFIGDDYGEANRVEKNKPQTENSNEGDLVILLHHDFLTHKVTPMINILRKFFSSVTETLLHHLLETPSVDITEVRALRVTADSLKQRLVNLGRNTAIEAETEAYNANYAFEVVSSHPLDFVELAVDTLHDSSGKERVLDEGLPDRSFVPPLVAADFRVTRYHLKTLGFDFLASRHSPASMKISTSHGQPLESIVSRCPALLPRALMIDSRTFFSELQDTCLRLQTSTGLPNGSIAPYAIMVLGTFLCQEGTSLYSPILRSALTEHIESTKPFNYEDPYLFACFSKIVSCCHEIALSKPILVEFLQQFLKEAFVGHFLWSRGVSDLVQSRCTICTAQRLSHLKQGPLDHCLFDLEHGEVCRAARALANCIEAGILEAEELPSYLGLLEHTFKKPLVSIQLEMRLDRLVEMCAFEGPSSPNRINQLLHKIHTMPPNGDRPIPSPGLGVVEATNDTTPSSSIATL